MNKELLEALDLLEKEKTSAKTLCWRRSRTPF